MLKIENLHVEVEGKQILRGIDLEIDAGQTHAIMGPNGSGKSTLSYVMAGREGYEVTKGHIWLNGQDLLQLEPEARAAAGLFLAFQYPVEIPGVQMTTFLKTALNALRKQRGQAELDSVDFLKTMKKKTKELDISEEMMKRPVNTGFSGGEKKRNEILQMAMLEPSFCVLDETDSGLDIDALSVVADGVNKMRDDNRSFMLITHYQRLLEYIQPDKVHILAQGRIIRSGGPELAQELEEKGYSRLMDETEAA